MDTIPLTSVGKIYKPRLRCDAAERVVSHVVREELGLLEARVQVREGGRRGMTVRVTLPDTLWSSLARVQETLKAYLFEVEIEVQ
jgi:fatty-acyl-CoA synthase